eukprot:3124630-Rhodomonas_salina.1
MLAVMPRGCVCARAKAGTDALAHTQKNARTYARTLTASAHTHAIHTRAHMVVCAATQMARWESEGLGAEVFRLDHPLRDWSGFAGEAWMRGFSGCRVERVASVVVDALCFLGWAGE